MFAEYYKTSVVAYSGVMPAWACHVNNKTQWDVHIKYENVSYLVSSKKTSSVKKMENQTIL
jgi:hypothetical protein